MSVDKKSQEWMEEFGTFLRHEMVAPPRAISESIVAKVQTELNPSLSLVASKLFAAHAVAAAAVVSVCPQLRVGPMIGGHGLMHFFMVFGPLPCAALCGALFLGVSGVLSSVFLKREELRLANRHRFLSVSLLAAVTFVGLILSGGESDRLSYLFWILGALMAGWITLFAGAYIRLRPTQARLQLG